MELPAFCPSSCRDPLAVVVASGTVVIYPSPLSCVQFLPESRGGGCGGGGPLSSVRKGL